MPSVCFYFQVHQPFRIKRYSFFDIGNDHFYEDEERNREILNKVAEKCYLPANKKMLDLIHRHNGEFRISYSISGTAIEQFEKYRPDVLQSFIALAETGCVEFLSETYNHSLSFLYSRKEFRRQIEKHRNLMEKYFGQKPKIFRNTELIFNNDLAEFIEDLGYKGILCEGVDNILGYRSPNFLYDSPEAHNIKLLLKNHRLSDDIAFRFSNKNWEEYPLTSEKFSRWIFNIAGNGETVNLFMDYETFGEHQWEETGIFNFLDKLPEQVLAHPDFDFKTPSEIVESYYSKGTYDVPQFISWADTERDLSAWLHNSMQKEAAAKIYELEDKIKACGDDRLINIWEHLQTSDHFYYMCTKFWNDGDVHKYFSPYDSPYDAYIYYMNVFSDLEATLNEINDKKSCFSPNGKKRYWTDQFYNTAPSAKEKVV